MALVNEKWRITDGPSRWDLFLMGLVGQNDVIFELLHTCKEDKDGPLLSRRVREHTRHKVKAMVLLAGPAKCPFVTHPNDRSQDEWIVLLIFRNGPLAEQNHWFHYNCVTRKGFKTEKPYVPKEEHEKL